MPRASSAARRRVGLLFAEHAEPPERLTLSEWSDRYRMLSSKSSAEPGRWRTSRTPYLREIMDALSPDSPVQDVWFMKGAQVGATEVGSNWTGYVIDHCPGPMLFVQPTLDMAKRAAQQRIDPLVEETPRIKAKLPPKRSKDGGNSLFSKQFPGGVLQLAGANSATSLRSMPARYLFLDEVDAYPGDLDGEGDPIALANARTSTFRNRKRFYVSTPTIAGLSRIEKGFASTDQRRYFVPCPHCGEMQTIEWPRIRFDKTKPNEPAWLECVSGCRIEERSKGRMLAAGEWRATAPENASATVRGYHLSALYSPFGNRVWSDIRDEFLSAQGNQIALKTWANTKLGETWQERGDAPPWARLYERRETYERGTIPMGGVLLTAGCDVQKDRIEVELRAWGPRYESWSVDYLVFEGDTADLEGAASPWRKMDEILARRWPHASGVEIPIACMAVDSGYATSTVYQWARRHDQHRVAAVKGSAAAVTLIGHATQAEISHAGKRIRRGLKVWPIGVSVAKVELYGWLRQDSGGDTKPTGWTHFPDYPEEYFKQLTAEQLVSRQTKRGYVAYEWQKTRERNEALDCAVYARAAASIRQIDRMTDADWRNLAKALCIHAPEAPAVIPEPPEDVGDALADALAPPPPERPRPPPPPAPKPKPRRPGFWDRRGR